MLVQNNNILSAKIEDLNTVFDFSEGIISGFSWDIPKNDFLMTVFYNGNEPADLKDQDVVLRFVNCHSVYMNMDKIIENTKTFSLTTPWQEIESIDWQKENDMIAIKLSSHIAENFMELRCQEVWIERIKITK